ncbi:MAG: peptide chain release factor N(5)-glutamine methyltransferase, partial [Gammaproteobacteria bacterium]|nr:peptide chain release factor N(5)-glutamine methyltransferase [Gammaproteobacteria bacterium]
MSTERSLASEMAPGPASDTRTDQLLGAGTRLLATSSDSPRLDAELLLAHALGKDREHLYRTLSTLIPAEVASRYAALLEQRAAHRPLAHITGRREFWSFSLKVTADTLVPRPETELLVEQALKRIPPELQTSVADLGTGTGAIAIAIATERPRCHVRATDLSPAALAIAAQNAAALGIRNISFHPGDWFAALDGGKSAVIVSNPPYIADDEWCLTDPGLAFEPRMALGGGADGLADIRRIISAAPAHLERGGWLLLEHGYRQAPAVRELLKQ